MKKVLKYIVLSIIYGTIYVGIELLYRGHSHWSMFVVGAIACLLIGELNEKHLTWEMGLLRQGLYGDIIILVLEFISGCILNLWLKWNVWDYSNVPLNILGQVCLPFAVAWFFLAIIAVIVDDILRWILFKEEKPRYYLLDHNKCD